MHSRRLPLTSVDDDVEACIVLDAYVAAEQSSASHGTLELELEQQEGQR